MEQRQSPPTPPLSSRRAQFLLEMREFCPYFFFWWARFTRMWANARTRVLKICGQPWKTIRWHGAVGASRMAMASLWAISQGSLSCFISSARRGSFLESWSQRSHQYNEVQCPRQGFAQNILPDQVIYQVISNPNSQFLPEKKGEKTRIRQAIYNYTCKEPQGILKE